MSFGFGLRFPGGSAPIVPPPVGQDIYTTAGTYSWTVPQGVTSICVVCIGGGAGAASNLDGFGSAFCGGGGGGLTYKNAIPVVPGASYTVVVGAFGGIGANGGASSFSGAGVSMTAGGGTATGRSGAVSGGDVNNFGTVPSFTFDPGGGLAYLGSGGIASYSSSETNNTPRQGSGGVLDASVTILSVVYTGYTANPNGFTASLLGDGGSTSRAGSGGFIRVSGGVPSRGTGIAGGVRIIWGPGRSYPNNSL